MSAKSVSALFKGLTAERVRRATRNVVSVLVLTASLAALALVIHNQYGPFGGAKAGHSGEEAAGPVSSAAPSGSAHPDEGRYRAISEFLARRYRVSQDVIFDLVSTAHGAGRQLGLDPLLIIAVIAVESSFNPIAESVAGARGLMQIIPKYHGDKLQEFGGEKALFDPTANILVGSRILKEYLGRTGDMSAALQMYAGALDDAQVVYTNRVMIEKQRLQQVVKRADSPPVRTAAQQSTRL
jgi:soluble lytic murein transglycosylase-like protein